MKRRYELEDALRLLPLLTAIQRELDERSVAVQGLTRRQRSLTQQHADDERITNVVAELAQHKRELRLALEELESLGCVAEPGIHSEVYIPGPDGSLESGYRLDGQGNLSAAETAGAET